MKRLMHLSLILTIIISMSSCVSQRYNTTYTKSDLKNKKIAILPYEVVTTGRIPENITEEMLLEIEEGESAAFQKSLYHQFLRQLDRKKYRAMNVKMQAADETNRKLKAANITIRDSWDIPSVELADLLGVDAVVRSSVHKTQYLTDLESYGIFTARIILRELANRPLWYLPSNKTSDVRISTSVVSKKDGTALWAASRKCPTNWANNTYDVIESINYSITRRLPR